MNDKHKNSRDSGEGSGVFRGGLDSSELKPENLYEPKSNRDKIVHEWKWKAKIRSRLEDAESAITEASRAKELFNELEDEFGILAPVEMVVSKKP